MTPTTSRLDAIRQEIDAGDRVMATWLVRRAALSCEAATLKEEAGESVRDEDRERQLRLIWSEAAGRALLDERNKAIADRQGFWKDLAYVFDSVLDFCSRQRG